MKGKFIEKRVLVRIRTPVLYHLSYPSSNSAKTFSIRPFKKILGKFWFKMVFTEITLNLRPSKKRSPPGFEPGPSFTKKSDNFFQSAQKGKLAKKGIFVLPLHHRLHKVRAILF